ncbi:MurT ligase domain-containing protein [Alicyclobacillus sp. SO9]|uniref:MurT ligase domain-containing protein n=1 Tax=Alicyclobacillus sp. SO9 TaxID=2665646 RepID=UPI0018E75832|nr:MurT ligase domain-containing protein [Alicyclobacillus sp. SO9]QQE80362.1 DUF1727 domain-containing protein [Alicyclobacillus sp. SO9]
MFGLWIGKLAGWTLRLLGRNATSFPGKLALRFSPNLLKKLGSGLDRCVVVTGTNGKTTTNRLLAAMMKQDTAVITNSEGANMQQGLVSALLIHASLTGKMKRKTAVLEVDEATLPAVAESLPVKVAVVTNVFRDQLDRYGELDTTLQKLIAGLNKTNATVVLNADDPLARHIGLRYAGPSLYYGMDRDQGRFGSRDQMRDGAFCLECGERLEYDSFFYGQLGIYHCPACDFYRPHPEFSAEYTNGSLTLTQGDLPKTSFSLPVRGLFNVYNALCAVAAARVLGLNAEQIKQGLEAYKAPLGRMQTYHTHPETILNLIKNPTGCDSVLTAIAGEPGKKIVIIAINDNAADGRDVSWLWDADFELIPEEMNAVHCVLTGLRGEDMALRLKYAGCDEDTLTTIPDMSAAADKGLALAQAAGDLPVYVLSTYTALYPMADILKRRQRTHDERPYYRPSVS